MNNKKSILKSITISVGLLITLLMSSIASAEELKLRLGVTDVNPDERSSQAIQNTLNDKLHVDRALALGINVAYYWDERWGVELLASTPFRHDISLTGTSEIGSTDLLPPTVNVLYNIIKNPSFTLYAGAGVNYTIFFKEKIDGSRLKLDDSIGLAFQLGADVPISDKFDINTSLRWIDIDTDIDVNGSKIGTLELDPWVYTLGINYNIK